MQNNKWLKNPKCLQKSAPVGQYFEITAFYQLEKESILSLPIKIRVPSQ